jgi:hypothetical protein
MAQTMGDPSHLITNYKLLITNYEFKKPLEFTLFSFQNPWGQVYMGGVGF